MIDIHSHIMFGVDDGAKDIEKSLAILKNAEENGFTDIVLTPHHSIPRKYANDLSVLEQNLETLKNAASLEGINVKLYLGSEIDYYKDPTSCIGKAECLPINHKRHLLVDFTFDQKDIDDKIYELMVAGYKVVIAHPERYKSDDIVERIKKWRKTGAVIQVDAMSFNLKKSKKICKKLLKDRVIDVIASDAHRNEHTYTEFKKVLEYIKKKTDEEYVELITKTNPHKIIFGK